jgi:hypothetical protein
MENVFSKVTFNGSLSITGTGFKAVGASGTTLLNGITQGYFMFIIYLSLSFLIKVERPAQKIIFFFWKTEIF